MEYDKAKLDRLTEAAERAADDRTRWQEKARQRGFDVATAEGVVIRGVTSGRFEMDPPQRFRTGHNSGDFLKQYRENPRSILAVFEKESPAHDLLHPMRHHVACLDAHETARQRLAEAEQAANHYLHLVRRCREFISQAGIAA